MNADPNRRRLLQMLGTGAIGLAATPLAMRLARAEDAAPREIAVIAQRFFFTPKEIPLKLGEPVVLAVKALDFPHGFNVPELGIRMDLIPGRVVKIPITPTHAGIVPFLCDNFCGEGHETMGGHFVVSA